MTRLLHMDWCVEIGVVWVTSYDSDWSRWNHSHEVFFLVSTCKYWNLKFAWING